jgi:diguanylate cyclase (GGDEF)-like protein/PAS domain S-box-containing protein
VDNNDAFFKEILDNLYDGVYFVDLDRTIRYWNNGAELLSGYSSSEVVGTACWDDLLMHVDSDGVSLCRTDCPLHKTMQSGIKGEAEIFLHHKDGHRVPVRVRATPLRNGQGNIIGAVEIFSDNSESIHALEMVEELQRKVFLDPLTGLANRRYIDTGLPARFDEMIRYGWQFGVIMMDIDRFKSVNDRHGHDVGDEALKMVARTLLNSSRSSDIVGRWGGEEFVAVLSNVTSLRLRKSAERHRMLVERSSLRTETGPINVTISAGATIALPGDTPRTLLKRADRLMYESKDRGRNCVTSD